MLSDEIEKAKKLAAQGLADDYIILTNHALTGQSEIKIKKAFEAAGVGRCRVFHRDWIIKQIRSSARLRMLVPRLYGLGDLSDLLDARAYAQAQLILSEMGDNLQKLVVTEAHRKSVRAISDHNLVLLLGSPAAGKSTIGASLAIGAADLWQCSTVKSTSPEHLQRHLNPNVAQFFWIDDAWGSTQYQRDRTEAWNQVFPLMQGAMKRGTRFLITSRDYIWSAARKDLKLQALPVLTKSQVIINVHELALEEKARILYNHLKFGDQDSTFKAGLKPFLPEISKRHDFLPESARRLGNKFFTTSLRFERTTITAFFERPEAFLKETIETLSAECKSAIALLFMNGGQVRSPVSTQALEPAAEAFGVGTAAVRDQLEALNGSILLLAEDEEGPYWTYKHPTVSDAFARYVAGSPELIEVYLRGAKPESMVREVVCAGIAVSGAPVVVPNSLHELLADRISNLPSYSLASFLSYRSNRAFSKILLERRPDIWKRLNTLTRPLKDDTDTELLSTLHSQNLLPESIRLAFVEEVRIAAVEDSDSSFLDDPGIAAVLTKSEQATILNEVESLVLRRIDDHVARLRESWDREYEPDDYFDDFRASLRSFSSALADRVSPDEVRKVAEQRIRDAVYEMRVDYEPPSSTSTPSPQSPAKSDSLGDLFRDVDE
jgi:hypothetical protein